MIFQMENLVFVFQVQQNVGRDFIPGFSRRKKNEFLYFVIHIYGYIIIILRIFGICDFLVPFGRDTGFFSQFHLIILIDIPVDQPFKYLYYIVFHFLFLLYTIISF